MKSIPRPFVSTLSSRGDNLKKGKRKNANGAPMRRRARSTARSCSLFAESAVSLLVHISSCSQHMVSFSREILALRLVQSIARRV